MSDLKIALVLSAIDRASSVINSVANKSISKITQVKNASDAAAGRAFDISKKSAVASAALAGPIVYAIEKAIDFEDKMADVGKVFNVKVGSGAFLQLGNQAKDVSEYLGKAANDGAALMASLGQGGVDTANLKTVSIDAGEVAVAFDVAADAAGDYYTKMHNALNVDWNQTKKVADAINFLSDTQASSAKDLLEYMSAGGAGVARASKMTGEQSAAYGSYLVSVGKSGAEASTIMERFYKGIMKNEAARKSFMGAGQGSAGIMAVLQKGAGIKNADQQFKYFAKFGEYGNDIRLMANNMKQVKASVDSVAHAENYAGSVHKEFANRNSTTKGQIERAWASIGNAVIDFGTNGLPILTQFLKAISPIIKDLGTWIKNNGELSGTILKVMAGASAASFIFSGLSGTVGGVMKGWGLLSKVMLLSPFRWIGGLGKQLAAGLVQSLVPALGISTTAVEANSVAWYANPATWVIAGIVAGIIALAAASYLIYKHWRPISNWFSTQWGLIKAQVSGAIAVFNLLNDVVVGIGKSFVGIFTFNPQLMIEGAKQAAAAFISIKNGGLSKAYTSGYDNSMASQSAKSGYIPFNAFAKPGQTIAANPYNPFGSAYLSAASPASLRPIKPVANKTQTQVTTNNNVKIEVTGVQSQDSEKVASNIKKVMEKWQREQSLNRRMTSYQ